MTFFVGTNPTEDSPVPDSWNSVIIPESDLVLVSVQVLDLHTSADSLLSDFS